MFKPGDNVLYIGEQNGKKWYTCVVITSNTYYTQCHFFATTDYGLHPVGHYFGQHTFLTSKYILSPSSLTKDERVLKKIKTLWNNSKYVKNNPKTAY